MSNNYQYRVHLLDLIEHYLETGNIEKMKKRLREYVDLVKNNGCDKEFGQ